MKLWPVLLMIGSAPCFSISLMITCETLTSNTTLGLSTRLTRSRVRRRSMKSAEYILPCSSTIPTRSPSPSKPMPRSAPVSLTLAMRSRMFSNSSGLASWLGKFPSGSQ